jgi:hypothetical protein
MARTEYAEIVEGPRTFGVTVTAHRTGSQWHIRRESITGSRYVGTAQRDTTRPTSSEWVLSFGPDSSHHPTLGTALSAAARLAAVALKAEVEAEEQAAATALPAMQVTSTCPDCGATVPTIRTGEGWPDLPRCPATTSQHQTGHRVPRDDFDAALRLREVQAGLATRLAAGVTS